MDQNEQVTIYVNCKLYIGAMDLLEYIEDLQHKYLKDQLANDKDLPDGLMALSDLTLWIGEQIPKEINGQEQT